MVAHIAKIEIKDDWTERKKPKVFYVDEKIKLAVGRGRFFREIVSEPGTEYAYYSKTYNAALLVKKLLRGKGDAATVEGLKKTGALSEGVAASILTLGKLSDGKAIGALWDMIVDRGLKINVMVANVRPIPVEKMDAFVKSEGIDGCAEWLFRTKDSRMPTLNMAYAMNSLVNLINAEGADTENLMQRPDTKHMFNLPKLMLTLKLMNRLGAENGLSEQRKFEIFESISNPSGYTVREYMMRALGDKMETAKLALTVMYKETSWENACDIAEILISPREDIAEPVQIEMAIEMLGMVRRLQWKHVSREDAREWMHYNGIKDRLKEMNFQLDILRTKEICSEALHALIEVSRMLDYKQGYMDGYEKGKAEGAASVTTPQGVQH